MELNLHKQSVASCELMLDTAAEHSIECDMLLPDYCPDIVRVLCCRVDTSAVDCRISKGVFVVEGTAAVEICYMAEVGGVRRCSCKIPFIKSFDIKRQPQKPIWSVNARQGHINCRAASRRRLDVRGAIVITAKVYDTAGQQAVSNAEGMGVQLCKSEKPAVEIANQLSRQLNSVEMLTLPNGKTAAEIVSMRCTPTVTDARVMASRILLKGEMNVHLLYKPELDSALLETADYNLPISYVLDADDLSDDMRCEAAMQCISAECIIDEDQQEMRFESQLLAMVRLYRPIVLTGAVDSFSTLYPTQNMVTALKVPKNFSALAERSAVKDRIELPQGFERLIDLRADVTESATEHQGDEAVISAKIKFTGIMQAEDTPADAFSHICDAKITLPLKCNSCELLINPTAAAAYGVITDGMLELCCDFIVSGAVIEWENQNFITDLEVDISTPRQSDPTLGMVIYYAEAGERVWDIAKRFGALPDSIIADNALKSDIIESDMPLIIPAV